MVNFASFWSSIFLLAFASGATQARTPKRPIFVAIDDASVKTIGPMPLDRSVYAQAIDAASRMGAAGVVLKFFFDEPRNAQSDATLAEAIAKGRVLMQVEPAEKQERDPAPIFLRTDWSLGGIATPYDLGAVAPPLPAFEKGAAGLGFVSAREGFDRAVEVTGTWRGKPVGSLQIEAIELAVGERARVSGKRLEVGGRTVGLDQKGRVACDVTGARPLRQFGIDQLLSGAIPRDAIEGHVVVLGYARSDSPKVKLGLGEVGVHEAFNRQVACLYGVVASTP